MPSLALSRVVLYVRDIPTVAAFYQQHFGLQPLGDGEPGWLELVPPGGGCAIALHCFSNAKDPAGNAISISSRGMA